MSHNVIFQSEALQDRADSRWDQPLTYSQDEMDAWNPGTGKFNKDLVAHLVGLLDEELTSGETLVVRGRGGDWTTDLYKAETWAANTASHLARAYVIARALEKRGGSAEVARKAVLAQQTINRLHDEAEGLIADIEGRQ